MAADDAVTQSRRYLRIAALCKLGYFLLFCVALGMFVGGGGLTLPVGLLLSGCLVLIIVGTGYEMKADKLRRTNGRD